MFVQFERRRAHLSKPPQRRRAPEVRPPGDNDEEDKETPMEEGEAAAESIKEPVKDDAAVKMPEHPGADSSDSEQEELSALFTLSSK